MIKLTTAEEKLAEIIWEKEKIPSPTLVELSFSEMGWKKSTTYTVLKKLCHKGVCKNEHAIVEVLLSKEDLKTQQSRSYVKDSFGGSLPRFVSAFIGGGKISAEEAEELKGLIDSFSKGGEIRG